MIKYFFLLLAFLIINSHTSIHDLRTLYLFTMPNTDAQPGDYYKDIHNDQDKFVGTWVYEDSYRKVEISINQREREGFGWKTKCFVDLLQLEYKYYENGVLVKESDPRFRIGDDAFQQIVFTKVNLNQEIHLNGQSVGADLGYSVVYGRYDEYFGELCEHPGFKQFSLKYETTTNNVNGTTTVGSIHYKRFGRSIKQNAFGRGCEYDFVLPEEMTLIKQS
ncbi:DUF6705 family protein [Nonlabens sp. SY33080]|uniref:DUF6705 family protein n=1 Tax=unclassified Nonlabens TaxID=2615035 RepID=UPI001428C205|nr:DUF6705 family protein [Nonlabens sp. SY33080]